MSYRRYEEQTNKELIDEAKESLPGWANIIDLVDKQIQVVDKDYQVGQIKEKFGALRYYIRPSAYYIENIKPNFDFQTDPISIFIADAENRSLATCEKCGRSDGPEVYITTDAVGDGYWIKTLCNECRSERNVN